MENRDRKTMWKEESEGKKNQMVKKNKKIVRKCEKKGGDDKVIGHIYKKKLDKHSQPG